MRKVSFTTKAAVITAAALLFTSCGENAATAATTAATTTTTTAATTTTATETTTTAEETTTSAAADSAATDGKNTPALYKVSDEDSTVYLFGAIHCGNEDTVDFPAYVADAYNDSEIIACEIDAAKMLTDAEALQEVNKITLCEKGKTTADYLDEKIFGDVKAVFQELGIYNALYEMYKPGMWTSVAAQYMMAAGGLSGDYGVDSYIVAMATVDGKDVVELETPLEQYELLFNGGYDYDSCAMLSMSTKELIDEQVALLGEMYSAWANGTIAQFLLENGTGDVSDDELKALGMTEEMLAASEAYNNKMYTERNIAMNEKTKELLAGEKNVFITVGCAHIEAEDGIVALLTGEGYNVERVG